MAVGYENLPDRDYYDPEDAALAAFIDDAGATTVHRYRGGWLQWSEATNCFRLVRKEQLEQDIYRALQTDKPGAVAKILHRLKIRTFIDDDCELPLWWRARHNDPQPADVIAHAAGLFVTKDFLGGQSIAECLRPATARMVTFTALPYAIDATATCPAWLHFLAETFGGDDRERLLREWFGYCLTADVSLQKSLWLVGAAAGGKGVIAETLCELVGKDNTSNTRLEDFGQQFALSAMLGKTVNWADEASRNTKVAEDKFKALVGGGTIQVDRKNQEPVRYKTLARLVVTCNELPFFHDKSDGIWRRLLPICFDRSVPEDQRDFGLLDKLRGELPGIFLWAVAGLRRLREQGRFTVPAASQELLDQHRAGSDPLGQFIGDSVVYDDQAYLPNTTLVEAYKDWAHAHNFQANHNVVSILRELRKQFPMVQKCRPRSDNGRIWASSGVRLRRADDPVSGAADAGLSPSGSLIPPDVAAAQHAMRQEQHKIDAAEQELAKTQAKRAEVEQKITQAKAKTRLLKAELKQAAVIKDVAVENEPASPESAGECAELIENLRTK